MVSALQYAVLNGIVPSWVNTEEEQRQEDLTDNLLSDGVGTIDFGNGVKLEVDFRG